LVSSFLINLSIVVVFAKVFYDPVNSPPIPGLFSAANVLEKTLGEGARYVWAVGLLASGQSSTMTATLAVHFLGEGFLRWNIKPWQRVAFTRALALVPSVLVAVLASHHLDSLGEYLNVLQSIVLPFALIPIFKITSSPAIMQGFSSALVASVCGG